MTVSPVIVAVALSLAMQAQQAPGKPAPQREAGTAVTFTGCVVPALAPEDHFQLVPAEPDPARPVGTSGTSPAWTVSSYLLLGGVVSFAEHSNKLVEVTGTVEPEPPAPADPKRGDTTSRTQAGGTQVATAQGNARVALPSARLNVTAAKVVAGTCTPRKTGDSK